MAPKAKQAAPPPKKLPPGIVDVITTAMALNKCHQLRCAAEVAASLQYSKMLQGKMLELTVAASKNKNADVSKRMDALKAQAFQGPNADLLRCAVAKCNPLQADALDALRKAMCSGKKGCPPKPLTRPVTIKDAERARDAMMRDMDKMKKRRQTGVHN